MESTVHGQDDFVITDSEFAFGWHFFVASVNEMVTKLADMMEVQFNNYKEKVWIKNLFLYYLKEWKEKDLKIKFALKEEMESSKFGIF